MAPQTQATTAMPAGPASVGDGAEPLAVIHTEQLTKVYPGADFTAVDKLDLDVRSGEIFGLLGRTAPERRLQRGCLRRG